MSYAIKENTVSAQQFNEICLAVGWFPPPEKQTAAGIENSLCVFGVYDDDTLIGMGRLLGDKAMTFYIKDFAILPKYQGKDVGRLLIEHMKSYIQAMLLPHWKVSIELISSKGREGFYSRFGFELRPSADDGAGMFTMIEP